MCEYAFNALHASYALAMVSTIFVSFFALSPYFVRLTVAAATTAVVINLQIFFCVCESHSVFVVWCIISLDVFFLSHSCVRLRSFSFRIVVVTVVDDNVVVVR